jgi:hypothetical protein
MNHRKRAEQYRNFAKQCLLWAKLARTDLERRDFLDMAKVGRRAAAEYEGVPDWSNNGARDTSTRVPSALDKERNAT